MTSNTHPIQQNPAFSVRGQANAMSKAAPVALTLLVWLFAASLETGYVAVLNSGIQYAGQTGDIA